MAELLERAWTLLSNIAGRLDLDWPSIVLRYFAVIGVLSTSIGLYRFTKFISLNIHRSSLSRYHHPNAWALVTGASDGIGLRFAEQLASHGFNVVLHGRNLDKLSKVVERLSSQHPDREFTTVIADASKGHGMQAKVDNAGLIVRNLSGPLTVLVNNVGGNNPMPGEFCALADAPSNAVDEVINLNVRFTVQLTRELLPELIANQPALVLTTGSFSANYGAPYLSLYSASKAYLTNWSIALSREMQLEGHDVECLCINVGKTVDASIFRAPATFFAPSATTLVRGALQKVGCGRQCVEATVGHAIIATFMSDWLPEGVVNYLVREETVNLAAPEGWRERRKKEQ